MPGPLIVGAEGVILLPDKDSYAASRPIEEGLELILQLKDFPTSSVTVICHTENEEGATWFMRMNGLPEARVICTPAEDRNEHPASAHMHAIARERARGAVNLVVTSFRDLYDSCTRSHQAVVLFGRRGTLSGLGGQASWEEVRARVQSTKESRLESEQNGEDRTPPW